MYGGSRILDSTGRERAASAVIGVILMLAITVILGGFIGTFVLDLDDRPPDSTFGIDYSDAGDGYDNHNDAIHITHEGGEAINPAHLRFYVGDTAVDGKDSAWSRSIDPGDAITITDRPGTDHPTVANIESGDEVQVVWNHPTLDRTALLISAEMP